MKMNIFLTFLLFFLLFCVIAQPYDITLRPFHVSFRNLGYGLGIILIIIGAICIHIESRRKAINECANAIKESFMSSFNLTQEQSDSLWEGKATIQELKPDLFKTEDGDKCNHEN